MMPRLAFYAPMKSPNSPVPSGDREMARNLMTALGAGGARIDLVSEFRIYDGAGDPAVQARLRAAAQVEAARLCRSLEQDRPTVWITYHSYYKSPDLIGPVVSRALNIPYVLIESTRAHRRLTGPWADFAAGAEAACDAAGLIFYVIANDLITLERERTGTQALIHLHPFLPQDDLPATAADVAENRPMLTAAMMRSRDKLDSYAVIARTLHRLTYSDWRLDIAGDGPARAEVAALMAPFGSRVRLLGQLDRVAMTAAYQAASLFFWPGVNEAYGMVYLEAQAAGLPVVAQDRIGVCDVMAHDGHPDPAAGADGLAHRIDTLLGDPALRRSLGQQARAHVARHHLLPVATETLWRALEGVIGARA